MTTPVSKITSRFRTTVPKTVRERLGLRSGDLLRYKLEKNRIVIERCGEMLDSPFAIFSEWAGEADERAYKSL